MKTSSFRLYRPPGSASKRIPSPYGRQSTPSPQGAGLRIHRRPACLEMVNMLPALSHAASFGNHSLCPVLVMTAGKALIHRRFAADSAAVVSAQGAVQLAVQYVRVAMCGFRWARLKPSRASFLWLKSVFASNQSRGPKTDSQIEGVAVSHVGNRAFVKSATAIVEQSSSRPCATIRSRNADVCCPKQETVCRSVVTDLGKEPTDTTDPEATTQSKKEQKHDWLQLLDRVVCIVLLHAGWEVQSQRLFFASHRRSSVLPTLPRLLLDGRGRLCRSL